MISQDALLNWATQWQRSFFNESYATAGRLAQIPTLVSRAQRIRKGASPSEVVYEEDRLKLLHFLSDEKPKFRTPLVVVYALVNRPYILDLKPGRSVIAHFIDKGFDTYLVDWGVPTYADRHLTFDDYINGYLVNVTDYLRERTGETSVNILAYCMGGTISAMFTSLHPDRVKNLILMAAPIDFSSRDGLLNLWTQQESFDVDKFIDAFGNCPADFLQSSFLLLKPVGNLIEKQVNFIENLHDEKFVDDFLTTETWLNDNIPVPGEIFRQFVKYLYQKNLLALNRMPVGKHIVNLQDIVCPVLNIMAGKDDLVPCSQGMPFTDLVGSKDRKTIVLQGSGHVGLAIAGRAQKEVWPAATEWLAERSS
jgi:polyhydroxyalkanoate synthase